MELLERSTLHTCIGGWEPEERVGQVAVRAVSGGLPTLGKRHR